MRTCLHKHNPRVWMDLLVLPSTETHHQPLTNAQTWRRCIKPNNSKLNNTFRNDSISFNSVAIMSQLRLPPPPCLAPFYTWIILRTYIPHAHIGRMYISVHINLYACVCADRYGGLISLLDGKRKGYPFRMSHKVGIRTTSVCLLVVYVFIHAPIRCSTYTCPTNSTRTPGILQYLPRHCSRDYP